ncbi:MAG: tRNA (cytidine(34)-2'-O)-methyltransferase [Isosphaeraceae bacterium]
MAGGTSLWLVRLLGFRLDDRNRKRAGLDYWEHLDLYVVDSAEEIARSFPPERIWSFTTKATRPYFEAEFRPGDALVFGPESRGLPDRWLKSQPPDHLLRIPMRPEARSLNLANAVAVGLYEALRQTGHGD